jgi:hypothetical protein
MAAVIHIDARGSWQQHRLPVYVLLIQQESRGMPVPLWSLARLICPLSPRSRSHIHHSDGLGSSISIFTLIHTALLALQGILTSAIGGYASPAPKHQNHRRGPREARPGRYGTHTII